MGPYQEDACSFFKMSSTEEERAQVRAYEEEIAEWRRSTEDWRAQARAYEDRMSGDAISPVMPCITTLLIFLWSILSAVMKM